VNFRGCGGLTIKNSQRLDQLLKYREHLMKHPVPDMVTMNFDLGVDEFGVAQGEFED